MNELIEKLLQPVSAEQPCGPDLSNDPGFDALEILLKGKPEVEMGNVKKPAEPPEWTELQKQSAAYLAKSKHLRVAVIFCCCQLKTGGLPGLRDGLQFIRTLLEKHWAEVHPQLDKDDNNDPERRLNILRALTLERAAMAAGWLAILDYLYAADVCRPKGLPPLNFDQLIHARQNPTDSAEASKLEAVVRSLTGEAAALQHQALKEAIEALQGIDQFLTATLGSGRTISFEVLENALKQLLELVGAYLSGGAANMGAETASIGGEAPRTNPAGNGIQGPVTSREEVVRAIDSICSYYAQAEPGSPVPYLLRRAQKMVKMNFIQTVQELNIATADTLRPSMGGAVDASGTATPGNPPA